MAARCLHQNLTEQWTLNPGNSISMSVTAEKGSLIIKTFEFFRFIDGVWKVNKHGSTVAGLGGFINDHIGESILYFLGSIRAAFSYEAELGSLKALMELLLRENWKNTNLITYTDSKNLVNQVLFIKAKCTEPEEVDQGIRDLIQELPSKSEASQGWWTMKQTCWLKKVLWNQTLILHGRKRTACRDKWAILVTIVFILDFTLVTASPARIVGKESIQKPLEYLSNYLLFWK